MEANEANGSTKLKVPGPVTSIAKAEGPALDILYGGGLRLRQQASCRGNRQFPSERSALGVECSEILSVSSPGPP